MLAHVVLLDEQGIHGQGGIDAESDEGHLGALLHDFSVIDRVVGRGAPGEGTMVLDEDGRGVVGVDLADVKDLIHNDVACLKLILSFNFRFRHITGAGDVLVEVVGMGGADVGDITTCLCEGGGVGGVGVDHALDVGESLVEDEVRRGVAAGVEIAFDDLARLEIHNHHVGGFHLVVADAGGLDDDKTLLAVDARDVTPCEDNQPLIDEVEVGLENFLFEFF